MLTVEAGSGWWLTSLKQRLEEKENRQCVCEGDSKWTLKCSLLNYTCSPLVSFLSMGERNDKTPPLIPISFCLSRFPSSYIFVSLLPSFLTLPIVTFLSSAANTKAKWLYVLYSSCIKWLCDRFITCCPQGIYRNCNNKQCMLQFFTLVGPFCGLVSVYMCMQ